MPAGIPGSGTLPEPKRNVYNASVCRKVYHVYHIGVTKRATIEILCTTQR